MDQEINNGPPPSPIRTKNSKFTAQIKTFLDLIFKQRRWY